MKIITASATIEDSTPNALQLIERAGRTCYKSEERITPDSADAFVRMIRDRGHMAMLDHAHASVRFIVDRGVSHEIVRHRIGVAYAQESTRFCNYSKGKYGSECTFIRPCFWLDLAVHGSLMLKWEDSCRAAETAYLELLSGGAKPQEARSVLPNSLKTELVMTASFTAWRHFFKQRTDKAAHPQMREVVVPLLAEFVERWPAAFDDQGFR